MVTAKPVIFTQKRLRARHWIALLAALLIAVGILRATSTPAFAQGTVIYVDADAAGNNTGSSWPNAYTNLQDALTVAQSGDEIWVAAGIYKPSDNPADPNAAFQLNNGVALYGGFTGTETDRAARSWVANPTILSGDIDNNDANFDGNFIAEKATDIQGTNSNHLVTIGTVTPATRLDGFIVTAGQGGAIRSQGGSPTLSNLVIQGNKAVSTGGGMYSIDSSPTLTNVRFIGNSAVFGGGYFSTRGTITLTEVYFESNSASDEGGGMSADNNELILRNVVFRGNNAVIGGALYTASTGGSLANVVVSGNYAVSRGGLYFRNSSLTLINVSISGNRSQRGPAAYNESSQITLMNTIVWNNEADPGRPYFENDGSGLSVRNSLIQGCRPNVNWDAECGGDDGGNLIDTPPSFLNMPDPDDAPTTAGDLRVGMWSHTINAGDNAHLPSDVTTDLAGNQRIVDGVVDLGAYEYLPAGVATSTPTPTPVLTSTPTPVLTSTPTPTRTPTPTPTRTPTPTPTFTPTQTPMPASTETPTPTPTFTPMPTFTPTQTATPTQTPTPASTETPTPTPTFTPMPTFTPTQTATPTPMPASTETPTPTPTFTPMPTFTPTQTATPVPLGLLTMAPGQGDREAATNVTVTGSGFQGTATNAPTLHLGSVDLVGVNLVSSTQINAVVPAGLPVGLHDLFVINPNGDTVLLAGAFRVTSSLPVIEDVRPRQGFVDVPTTINVYGINFADNAVVRLGQQNLSTTRVDQAHLRATIPSGIAPNIYAVSVDNQNGQIATQPDGYNGVVRSSDDLFSSGDQLWSDPISPQAGESVIVGLNVSRQGGVQATQNTTVAFSVDGTPIGTGTINALQPNGTAGTSGVAWTPPGAGSYTLSAVIDPQNLISESNETNNSVSRTISVRPAAVDQTPPTINTFTINQGAGVTVDQTVSLTLEAIDAAPGSGVQSVLFTEYEYNQGAGAWVPAGDSEWLPYAGVAFTWNLLPSSGVKYLRAWAADAQGNVSTAAGAFINLVPPSEMLAQDEARIYRYTLQAGDEVEAVLTPLNGDADLYVWLPNPDAAPLVSNLEGDAVENIRFVATQNGTYQVEVFGFETSEYRLEVTVTPASRDRSDADSNRTANAKPVRTQPLISLDSEPVSQQALPTAPILTQPPAQPQRQIYLPVVER